MVIFSHELLIQNMIEEIEEKKQSEFKIGEYFTYIPAASSPVNTQILGN